MNELLFLVSGCAEYRMAVGAPAADTFLPGWLAALMVPVNGGRPCVLETCRLGNRCAEIGPTPQPSPARTF